MKLKLPFLACALFLSFAASAQWSQRANFPGISKAKSTAFTIGTKIYVMGGVSNASTILKDFWEYDIPSDTWTQKPAFPGPERYGAVSFVINNMAYIATGGNDFGFLDDLWQYNPLTGTWVQKTGLPAGSPQHENQRTEAWSFVIGGKAYVGGGQGFVFGANSTNNTAFYDNWEYDPILDSWSTKADLPDFIGRNMSIGVSLNNKGYVGLGCDFSQTINYQSFWEYDPLLNSWTSKSNFPSLYTTDAGAFVFDSVIYVAGGVKLSPVGLSNQVYTFNPVTNAWTAITNFNGGAIAGAFAVSTGTSAFMGTGYNGNLVTRNDVWELSNPTGINENVLQADLIVKVYPNPTHENFSIDSQKEISSVEFFDVTGNRILKVEKVFDKINLQSLNSGIYNLKVNFKDGSFVNKRFIKAN